jgi:septal ring factor EnvC (AmiA/AmiB activator)
MVTNTPDLGPFAQGFVTDGGLETGWLSDQSAHELGVGPDARRETSSRLPADFVASRTLLRPVTGAVVTRFGDMDGNGISSRGLVFEAHPAAEVVAPSQGKVRFAGAFRNYGRVLIIDHGDGFHSLMAGLADIEANVDNRVSAGQRVGTMANSQGQKPRLLFELWRERSPVDPLPWVPFLEAKGKG